MDEINTATKCHKCERKSVFIHLGYSGTLKDQGKRHLNVTRMCHYCAHLQTEEGDFTLTSGILFDYIKRKSKVEKTLEYKIIRRVSDGTFIEPLEVSYPYHRIIELDIAKAEPYRGDEKHIAFRESSKTRHTFDFALNEDVCFVTFLEGVSVEIEIPKGAPILHSVDLHLKSIPGSALKNVVRANQVAAAGAALVEMGMKINVKDIENMSFEDHNHNRTVVNHRMTGTALRVLKKTGRTYIRFM